MLTLLYLALATSAISVTIAKARAFETPRTWITTHSALFGKLVSCAYCVSHYVAFVLILLVQPKLVEGSLLLNIVVGIFAIIALATLITGGVMRALWMHETEVWNLREELEKAHTALKELINAARQ